MTKILNMCNIMELAWSAYYCCWWCWTMHLQFILPCV